MELKTTGKGIVEEVPYGMYLWECADGEVAGDDEGNVMNVFCIKGDRKAIDALTQAAKHYGVYEGGKPVWRSGARRVTDEELEEQEMRAKFGLTPDPLDYGALRDDQIVRRNRK
jgi:hypothetical protein